MANALYDAGAESLLSALIDIPNDTMRMTLCDEADYTVNLTTDDFYNDVTAAGRVATVAALSSKTVTDGTFDAADATFTTVSGDQSESLVIDSNSGTESTSPLLCNLDTATGLPVTPSGSDIDVVFNASGILSIN